MVSYVGDITKEEANIASDSGAHYVASVEYVLGTKINANNVKLYLENPTSFYSSFL